MGKGTSMRKEKNERREKEGKERERKGRIEMET